MRAQKAAGNSECIEAAKNALKAVEAAAAANESDIEKRQNAISKSYMAMIKSDMALKVTYTADDYNQNVVFSTQNAYDAVNAAFEFTATAYTTDKARKNAYVAKEQADKAVEGLKR